MKRGSTAPWKISVQFEDQKPFKRAFTDRSAAMFGARDSLRAAQHRDLSCTVLMWCEPGTPEQQRKVTLVLDANEDVVPA